MARRKDAGAAVEQITIDAVRAGEAVARRPDLIVILGGCAVPGRYLRGMPASTREVVVLAERITGRRCSVGRGPSEPRLRSGPVRSRGQAGRRRHALYDLLDRDRDRLTAGAQSTSGTVDAARCRIGPASIRTSPTP